MSGTSTHPAPAEPSMRVYLHYEECWEIKRQWENAISNGWYDLRRDLVGWQVKHFYWGYNGEFVTIEWEPDPFPSKVCPQCHRRVAATDIETRRYYIEKDDHVCRVQLSMCSYCRDSGSGEWDWPRGENGRWLPSRDCEAVSA